MGIGILAALVAVAAVIVWMLLRNRPALSTAALNVSLLPPPATSFVFDRNGQGGLAISRMAPCLLLLDALRGKRSFGCVVWTRASQD